MEASGPVFLKGVDLFCESNNGSHHTDEITITKLVVRRGQPFIMTVKLTEAFNGDANPLTVTVETGKEPKVELGTKSTFSIPGKDKPNPKAKMVWKAELQKTSKLARGILTLIVTPPADCPVGKYEMSAKYKGVKLSLGNLAVLFNPWCPDDSVYLSLESKKREYVLNEQGVVYKGSSENPFSMDWDFGQFEDGMVDIAMRLLDKSLSYEKDKALDVASRGDPIYVGRVLTAMINSEDDAGVLQGNWSGNYSGGYSPSHWNSSYAILSTWYTNDNRPVKYGQCWVFACVMCSVMRLLGIPCRVVTNFASAHDVDRNLTIDTYHTLSGKEERPSPDSVWNFHVWVEGWFKRPDLSANGEFDGWQVLDPTPQETSGGTYRCGPAPVKAIKRGRTELKYDVPFVFAEVNADCVDWLIYDINDNNAIRLESNTKKVGKKISTKWVGLKQRRDITSFYKHEEGSEEERAIFHYATSRDYSRVDEWEDEYIENTDSEEEEEEEEAPPVPPAPTEPPRPPPEVTMRFEEVTQPIDGEDVKLNLVLHSASAAARQLTINVSVQAMRYNGVPVSHIFGEEIKKKLLPGQDLTVPIVVPYSVYHTHMVDSESMRIEVLVLEKDVPEHSYLAECNIVLLEPAIELSVSGEARVGHTSMVEVVFQNPIDTTLTNCVLTLTGSGLLKEEFECKLPDLHPDRLLRVKVYFKPYKKGERTILADFDCSDFRDLKASAIVSVAP